MPESTVEPTPIEVDIIRSGKATLICRWNIQQEIRENEDETQTVVYVYDEAWITWALPASFQAAESTVSMPVSGDPQDVRTYAEQYVTADMDEIMSYAMATKLSA